MGVPGCVHLEVCRDVCVGSMNRVSVHQPPLTRPWVVVVTHARVSPGQGLTRMQVTLLRGHHPSSQKVWSQHKFIFAQSRWFF